MRCARPDAASQSAPQYQVSLCKALQFVDRQVDATARRVFAHIAHDVGELESQAQPVGVIGGLRNGLAEDARCHFAHHTGHQVAVLLQVHEIQVAVLVQVYLAAVDHGQQMPRLNAVDQRVRHERLQRRVAGLASVGLGHFLAPPSQLGLRYAQVLHLVHHVVHLAAESIESGDGRAAGRRQEEKGVIEAAAGGGGLLLGLVSWRHGSGERDRV